MHHRNRSIVLASLASIALMAGSLVVGFVLRPDNAEATLTLEAKTSKAEPAPVTIELDDEIVPVQKVITIKEVVIFSKRTGPVMRSGTTVRDPRPVPAMGCGQWKDSLVGGQYRVCEVQQ